MKIVRTLIKEYEKQTDRDKRRSLWRIEEWIVSELKKYNNGFHFISAKEVPSYQQDCLFNGADKTVATGIACPCERCSPR